MTEVNKNLPEMQLPNQPVRLKENWLKIINPFLRYTFSQITFSVKSTLSEITELFHLVQVALPKKLAWKDSVRIGAESIQESDAILAWGQEVLSGPRMIGFSWDDFERNTERTRQIDGAKHISVESEILLLGDRYIEYIQAHFLPNCSTDMDLQQLVKEHFPHLDKWDAIDPKLDFLQAVCSDDGGGYVCTCVDVFEGDGIDECKEDLFPNSKILSSEDKIQLNLWSSSPTTEWQLCYQKTTNGASSSTFRSGYLLNSFGVLIYKFIVI